MSGRDWVTHSGFWTYRGASMQLTAAVARLLAAARALQATRYNTSFSSGPVPCLKFRREQRELLVDRTINELHNP